MKNTEILKKQDELINAIEELAKKRKMPLGKDTKIKNLA